MAELPDSELYDAKNIMVEMSDDGESGKLHIVTNRGSRLVVGASIDVLSELRRRLTGLFG